MKESVNSLVPRDDAELALLFELFMCGGEGDTGYIVERAMARFPVLQTQKELNRETPSGRGWWSGRFRFNISNLVKRGEAINVKRGLWRITEKGMDRIKRSGYYQK